jgi:uncharacterized membrane protein
VKVIGIKADTYENGQWVLETLQTAVKKKRVALDDIALVTHDAEGKVKLEQTTQGRFRDTGIDDGLMKQIGGMITGSQTVVFALGADASVDAIAAQVRELTGGDMETFVIDEDDDSVIGAFATDTPDAAGRTNRRMQ